MGLSACVSGCQPDKGRRREGGPLNCPPAKVQILSQGPPASPGNPPVPQQQSRLRQVPSHAVVSPPDPGTSHFTPCLRLRLRLRLAQGPSSSPQPTLGSADRLWTF